MYKSRSVDETYKSRSVDESRPKRHDYNISSNHNTSNKGTTSTYIVSGKTWGVKRRRQSDFRIDRTENSECFVITATADIEIEGVMRVDNGVLWKCTDLRYPFQHQALQMSPNQPVDQIVNINTDLVAHIFNAKTPTQLIVTGTVELKKLGMSCAMLSITTTMDIACSVTCTAKETGNCIPAHTPVFLLRQV